MMPRSMRLLYSVTLSLVSRRGRASTLATAWSPAFFSCSYVSQRTHHTSLPPIIPSSFAPTRASFGGGSVSLFHHSSSTTTTNDSNGDSKNENKKKLVGPAVQPPRPNDNTYWVIPNAFIAGEYPGDSSGTIDATRQKLRAYLDLGVTAFFDLTFPGENTEYESTLKDEALAVTRLHNNKTVEYHRYSIPNFGIPSDPNLMKELLEEMHGAMNERKQTVYIHCRGGIGRTGTTVGCFLKQYGNYENGDDALQELNRLFQTSGRSMESSYSPETPDQIHFVKEWNSN